MRARRRALLAALALPWARPAAAQREEGITLVIPFPAGGTAHALARVLARGMREALGQPVLLRHRPGLSGLLAHQEVALARPDGRTLVVGANGTYAMAAQVQPAGPDALAAASLLARAPLVLCVHGQDGPADLEALRRAAGEAPGRLAFANSGTGYTDHLAALLLADAFDMLVAHRGFQGTSPAAQAVVAGRAQAGLLNLAAVMPLVLGGALRALAVTAPARLPQLPGVPTLAESGMPGFAITTDFSLLLPAATPEEAQERLSLAAREAMDDPEARARFAARGMEVLATGRAEAAAHMAAEIRRWGAVLAAEGLRRT